MIRRLVPVAVVLAPAAAWSCPMCFGSPDNAELGRAFNTGMFMLMGSTFGLLCAGIVWLVRIERRRQALDARYFEMISETTPR